MRTLSFRQLAFFFSRPVRRPSIRAKAYRAAIESLEFRRVLSVTAGTPWTPFGQSSEPSIIITIGPKNTGVSIMNTGIGPYDGVEDTYIGVINNSGKALPSITVSATSASDIFGFDGDGIQTYGSPAPPTGGGTGYEGPDNFFSNITNNGTTASGKINFIGGLSSGQQTYFSLEGAPQTIEIGVDLQLTLDNSKIVPVQATNLHLNHFFGTESVRLPVMIQNIGTDPAKGNVKVDFFISTTPDLNGSVTGKASIQSTSSTINLAASESQPLNVDVTIDSNTAAQLTPGNKYYFVLQLSSPTINESDDNNGMDKNNIATSKTTYEYLGKPSVTNVFNSGTYFNVIRDTLLSVNPFQGAPNPTDGQHFAAAFETSGGYDHPVLGAYLDSKGIPTIGIGLNLNALGNFPAIRSALADDVRAFYSMQAANNVAGYSNIDSLKDNQVINMLKAQAVSSAPGQAALTVADAQSLFNMRYAISQQAAIMAVGGLAVWNTLSTKVQWVLTDIDFNTGSVANFHNLLADLTAPSPDFVRAGFDFLDSKRTNDVQYARSLAGFEFLLDGHNSELGQFV